MALLATATFNPLVAGSAVAIQDAIGVAESGAVVYLIEFMNASTILEMFK